MIRIEIKESNKLKTEEKSAFVSFPYDELILNEIRSYPFRYYIPETTCWEIPLNRVNQFIQNMKNYSIKLEGDLSVLNENKELKVPKGFEFKTKPYEHQIEGVEYGLNHSRWFLGDEQGLGKTKQAIDIAVARKIAYGYKHCLIVCGVNTLKWNWVNEIHTHSNEDCWIIGQRQLKNGEVKIGSTKDKIEHLKSLFVENGRYAPYFLITNVESFRDTEFADTVQKLCREGIINMCVADEMHKMKNPQAQQTKGFFKCLPECRIGMTGTPLMNSPLDLYVILKWLGYESHAFYSFKQHYCVMGGYGGYEIVGYKNMEQLTAQVREIMLRRLKEDVLDLPEKTYVDEIVEMDGKQAILYKEVKSGIKTALANGEIDLNNPLASLIRLRQTTGYPGIISEVTESAKLDRMVDLTEEALSSGQKVVIFSNWTQMTDEIGARFDQMGIKVSQITGETPDNQRQLIVDTFQNKTTINVLVGTIGAMGTGLTLTAATVVIFVDEPWNKALYDQAVDRCHRIGQKSNITVYNLLTKGTVDERIHELVYKKGVFSDAIIDGKIVGNKTEIFNYLIS